MAERLLGMSEETVRRVIAAFNAHDPDAWAAEMTPEGTFTSAFWGIDGRTYTGRDGFAEYFRQMGEQWDDFSLELVRTQEGEGKILAIAKLNAKESGTQVSVSPEQGFLFQFDGDKVASMVTIPNVEDALERLAAS